MSKPLLHIENLTITTQNTGDGKILARNIQLVLEPGEIIPIVGKSGVGKSTFLKTLVRFILPSDGSIIFKGKSCLDYDPAVLRSRMIYLSQTPGVFPGSVESNLTEANNFKHNRSITISTNDLTEGMKLIALDNEKLNVTIEKLSGGETQRVALLRALLLEPDILLLDEPTTGLDELSKRHIVDVIKYWVSNGNRGVIWVAHDLDIMRQIGGDTLRLTPDGLFKKNSGGANE